MELVPTRVLMESATRPTIELDHPAYDCLYLALAVENGCRFVTADERLVHRIRRDKKRPISRPYCWLSRVAFGQDIKFAAQCQCGSTGGVTVLLSWQRIGGTCSFVRVAFNLRKGLRPSFFNPCSAPALPVQTWGTRPVYESTYGFVARFAKYIQVRGIPHLAYGNSDQTGRNPCQPLAA
jgi:hypothetical protein